MFAFCLSFVYLFLFTTANYPPPLQKMLNTPTNNGSNLTSDSLQAPTSSSTVGNLSQKKTCPYCFQQLSWHALSRHIRDMHKSKSSFVTCKYCNKMFRNKNSLGCHMWRFHKEAKEKEKEPSSGDSGKLLETSENLVAPMASPSPSLPPSLLHPLPAAVENP